MGKDREYICGRAGIRIYITELTRVVNREGKGAFPMQEEKGVGSDFVGMGREWGVKFKNGKLPVGNVPIYNLD